MLNTVRLAAFGGSLRTKCFLTNCTQRGKTHNPTHYIEMNSCYIHYSIQCTTPLLRNRGKNSRSALVQHHSALFHEDKLIAGLIANSRDAHSFKHTPRNHDSLIAIACYGCICSDNVLSLYHILFHTLSFPNTDVRDAPMAIFLADCSLLFSEKSDLPIPVLARSHFLSRNCSADVTGRGCGEF